MTSPVWTPLRGLVSAYPSARAAARRLVEQDNTALSCGGYRWTDADSFLDSVLALSSSGRICAVAAHRLEVNDDPEVATAAGDRVVRVPVLAGEPADQSSAADLAEAVRRVHGNLRVSVNRPVRAGDWDRCLAAADFRPDSALSVSPPQPRIVVQRSAVEIRPAEAVDADAAARLFEQSQHDLARQSPFVHFEAAAVESVRARFFATDGGRTETGSRVWVAEDGTSKVVGIVEASLNESPFDYVVLQPPLGTSICIEWAAVAADRRGGGIGAHLVDTARSAFAAADASTAYAYHLVGAAGPAGFWARCGFVPAWVTWELAPAERTGW